MIPDDNPHEAGSAFTPGDAPAPAASVEQTTPIQLPADETPTIVIDQQAGAADRVPFVHETEGERNAHGTDGMQGTAADAAADQRHAAEGYAREAAHNGYPGGGVPPRAGNPYAAYPGWNRNEPTPPPMQRNAFTTGKAGASKGTVIWGIIMTVAAVIMAVPLAVGSFTIDQMFWLRAATVAALALGVALIAGAIVSAVRGKASRDRANRGDGGMPSTTPRNTQEGWTA